MAAISPPAGASAAELVRWSFERLDAHDITALRGFWTADTLERFPDRTCRGADEIAVYLEELFAAVPDLRMEVRDIVGQGEHVYAQWHLTGTHSGAAYAGIEPTGKRLALDGIDHFVIRDGKVESNFILYDQMQFARQIGLLPPDGSPADRALKAAFNAKGKVAERIRAVRG
jgi:steroid delta-isomerase-like uncharacterized protein